MSPTRRHLLGVAGGAGLVAGAGLAGTLAGCDGGLPKLAGPGLTGFDPTSWGSVRAQFALAPGVAHLSTFVFAPHPAPVRAAIATHRAALDRDPIGYLHVNQERLETAVARAAADHLRTGPDQLAFTDSTTMGLGLLYGGLRLRPGDEVLTTEHDFYATHESLRLRAERDDVPVRRVRLYQDPGRASVDEIVGNLAAALTPRTRVVAITWVHSGTGVKLPVRQIADVVRQRSPQARLCVDGVHGFAAEAAGPDELGCDFLVTGCHKWLLGPRGTGLLWGARDAWPDLAGTIPTFDGRSIGRWLGSGAAGPPAGPAHTPGGYHSFEHRWALAEAFGLHAAIGRDRVTARIRELAGRLADGLAGLDGVRLVTPRTPELSAGVVCCDVSGITAEQAVARLGRAQVIASAAPYHPSHLRFGATIANTEEDVEAAVRAVHGLL
jgi:selenocysteine lyase/cysteine desulfurase